MTPLRYLSGVRGRQGFTLIELMIVLIIMSLIVIALTAGQRFAFRAWQSQERQIEQQADVGAIQNALRQILMTGREFQGDDVSLRLVGNLPLSLNRGGLFDIELKTDEDRLVLSWRPHFKGPTSVAEPTFAVLAKGVSAFGLSYFEAAQSVVVAGQEAPAAAATPAQWQKSIPDKAKPPILIRVALRLSQGQWSPLIVAPMLDAIPAPAAPAPASPAGSDAPPANGQQQAPEPGDDKG
jgi:prepilin-type N-terminal cleavage/methylation domain-containing protein